MGISHRSLALLLMALSSNLFPAPGASALQATNGEPTQAAIDAAQSHIDALGILWPHWTDTLRNLWVADLRLQCDTVMSYASNQQVIDFFVEPWRDYNIANGAVDPLFTTCDQAWTDWLIWDWYAGAVLDGWDFLPLLDTTAQGWGCWGEPPDGLCDASGTCTPVDESAEVGAAYDRFLARGGVIDHACGLIGECTGQPDGTSCSDGPGETCLHETCTGPVCLGQQPGSPCDDGRVCALGQCASEECFEAPFFNPCTVSGVPGFCLGDGPFRECVAYLDVCGEAPDGFSCGEGFSCLAGTCEQIDPCVDAGGDADRDGICDDGDRDGSSRETPGCSSGQTHACDDNCPDIANADQVDHDANGVGDACQVVLELEMLDPIVDLGTLDRPPVNPLLSGGLLSSDPVALASPSAGRSLPPGRAGIAADGVTLVVVRIEVPGPGSVDLSVEDSAGQGRDVGALQDLDGSSEGPTLTNVATHALPDGRHVALARLRAPESFPGGIDDAQIAALLSVDRYTPEGGSSIQTALPSFPFAIRPPPYTLVHGLWSSADAWEELHPLPGAAVGHVHDYRETHAAPFIVNRHVPRAAVLEARRLLWNQSTAVTQVDYIGHSMGGILGRRYASGADGNYFRDDNLHRGDVNRLVTIDSPHLGSRMAQCINDILHLTAHPISYELRAAIAIDAGCPDCGALADLRPDSEEMQSLQSVDVPTHAITGSGGADWIENTPIWDTNKLKYELIVQGLLGSLNISAEDLFGGEDHDLVVRAASQQGGLPEDARRDYRYQGADEPATHSSIIEEPRVRDHLTDLLYRPGGSFLDTLPAPLITDFTCPPLDLPDRGDMGLNLSSSGPIGPGDTIQIGFSSDSFSPTHAIAVTGFGGALSEGIPPVLNLTVPTDALGDYEAVVVARDNSGQIGAARLGLQIYSPGIELVEIEPSAQTIVLKSSRPRVQLEVTGSYSDGITRDLTGTHRGTSFMSTAPDVAFVDEFGVVRARRVGIASLMVSNSDHQDAVFVIVESIPDRDGDGISDEFDNCPELASQDQTDSNVDGVGDLCDADLDGLRDGLDPCPSYPNPQPLIDTDGDDIPDECQCGDAIEDGILTGLDARRAQQCAAEIRDDCDPSISDATGDGIVTGLDARRIQQAAAEIRPSWGLTCPRRPEGDEPPAMHEVCGEPGVLCEP